MRRGRVAATLTAAAVVFALVAVPVLGQQMTAALVEEALVQLILRRHSDLLLAPHVQLGSASVLSADLRNSLVFVEVDNPQLQGRYLPAMLPGGSNTLEYGAASRQALRENPVTVWHEILHHQISLRGGEECGPEEAYNYLQEARVGWLDNMRRFDLVYRDTVADAAGCPRILSAWAAREQRFHALGLNGPYSGQDQRGSCGPADAVYVIDEGFIALWDQRLNIHFDLGDIRYAYEEKLDACAATVNTDAETLLALLQVDRDRAVRHGGLANEANELATGPLDEVAANFEQLEPSLRGAIAALDAASSRDIDRAATTVADLSSNIAQDLADAREAWQNASDFADEVCDAATATEAMDDATASEQSAEMAGQLLETAEQRLDELESIARESEELAQQIDDATATVDDAVGQLDRLDSSLGEAAGEIASVGEAAAALVTIEQRATGTHLEITSALHVASIDPRRAPAIQSEADTLMQEIRFGQQRRVAALHESLVSRHAEATANVDRIRGGLLEALQEIDRRVGPGGLSMYGVDEQILVEARSNTLRIGNYASLAAGRRDDGLRCARVFDDPDGDDAGDDSESDDPGPDDPGDEPAEDDPAPDQDDLGDIGNDTGDPSVGDPSDVNPGDDSTRDFATIDANLERYRQIVEGQEILARRVQSAATSSEEKLRSASSAIDELRGELERQRSWLSRLDPPALDQTYSTWSIRSNARDAIDEAQLTCNRAEDARAGGSDAEGHRIRAEMSLDDAWLAMRRAEADAMEMNLFMAEAQSGEERAQLRARVESSIGPPMRGESDLAEVRLLEIDLGSSRQQALDRLMPEADSLWARLAADLPADDDDAEVVPRLRDVQQLRRRQQAAEDAVRSVSDDGRVGRQDSLENELALLSGDFQGVREGLDALDSQFDALELASLRGDYEDATALVEEARQSVSDARRCVADIDAGVDDDTSTDPGTGDDPATGTNPFDDAADAGVGPGGGGDSPVTVDLSPLIASTRDALDRCDYLAARNGIEQIRRADSNHPSLADLSADFDRRTSAEMAAYQMLEDAKAYQGDLDRVVELLQGAMNTFPCPKPEINQAIAAVVGDSAARARQDDLARSRQQHATWTSILDTVLIGAAAVDNAMNPPDTGTTGATGGGGTGGADAGAGTGVGTGTASGSCKVTVWRGEGTGSTDLYWVLFEIQSGTYTGYYVIPFSREPGSVTPAEWARTTGPAMIAGGGGSPPKQLATGGLSAMEQAAYARCPR